MANSCLLASPVYIVLILLPNILFESLFQILHERQIPGDASTVQGVADVLAASQKYMRDQSVSKKSWRSV